MEFELDDYRMGRINKKVRNLNCINSTGYNNANSNKKNNSNTNRNNKENNGDKVIYVNSKNNNYLISKLKKENESLRLIVSEYENSHIKAKINEKKIRQRKIGTGNAVRITRKGSNVKPHHLNTNSINNITNIANNTFTTNFYRPKNNNNSKIAMNNNSLLINNKLNDIHTQMQTQTQTQNSSNSQAKIMAMNSYVILNKQLVKNRSKKTLSLARSTSKTKKSGKGNYKKISGISNNNNKTKDKKVEFTVNLNNNSRLHTYNNNINSSSAYNNNFCSKNVLTYKKKINKNLLSNTERKQSEENLINNSSHMEYPNNLQKEKNITINRNTVFIPKRDFNFTWSRFPRPDNNEGSFDNNSKNPPQSVMIDSKYITKMDNRNTVNQSSKYMESVASKYKYSVDTFDNTNLNEKKDMSPNKIKINRRIITNNLKNTKNFLYNKNASMKNIIDIRHKNKMNEFSNNKVVYRNNEGEIYTRKNKNSLSRMDINDNSKNVFGEKKNNNEQKYNVTINNINNCNYYSYIQENKPEIKIIKKRINKNN